MFKVLIQRSYTANLSLYLVSDFSAARSIGTPQYGEVCLIFNNLNQLVHERWYNAPSQCDKIIITVEA